MNQEIFLAREPVREKFIIPGSKSMTNRALLMAALSDGACEIRDILISDDTYVFMNALHQLGVILQLDVTDQSCIVGGVSGQFPKKEASIACGDAGTAARFLLAACASSPGKYHFDGSEQLRTRPLEGLLTTLVAQGVTVEPSNTKKMPFTIRGNDGLDGGEVEIDGSQSGQFVSALLMAAPFAQTMLTIETKNLVSASFVEMTCQMMAEFGVMVRRMHQLRFSVPVPQRYIARDYTVEPDLTTASYFFAAAAVTAGKVTIQAVDIKNSRQGDVKFLSVLEKMGCRVQAEETGLTVIGAEELQGVSVDMRSYSDCFMTLAAIAPFARTPTSITNIGHARLQESNRISVMREELEKLQVKVEEGPDWIKIYPSTPKAGVVDAHGDHRIAMSLAIIGLKVEGVIIQGAECVSKTCPEFFTMWSHFY